MPLSVLDPLSPSLTRTGTLLFRPFRFGKWFALAFTAWLTLLGEGGPNFNGNVPTRFGGPGPGPAGGPLPDFTTIRDWINAHFGLILLIFLALLLVGYAFYFLFRWINSRAQFMFLHNIVTDTADIKKPWAQYKSLGNSLFFFRILWDHAVGLVLLLILAAAFLLAMPDLRRAFNTSNYEFTSASTAALIFLVIAMLFFALFIWIFAGIVFRIALPVMFIRNLRAWSALRVAWREIFLANLGSCLLYFLALLLINFIQGIWFLLATILFALGTCCIGAFLLVLPLIGLFPVVFLSLPMITFERTYPLFFLSQLGPPYTIAWSTPPSHGFPITPDISRPTP